MSQKKIHARFQLRRDTASNWEAKNEVLLDGEKIIVVTASGQTRFKVGDGIKTFSQLPYTDEALNEAISQKVDAVAGKQLSTNDYTTPERAKLAGIAPGAEVNVQSDWNISSTTSDAYIKNKPTKLSDFENDSGFITVDDLPSYTAEDIGALPNPPGGTDGQVPVKSADGVIWQDLPSSEMIETFAILTAAGWNGTSAPFSQTLIVEGVTATSVQQILPPLNVTADQLKALQSANIQDGGQAADQITLLAFGRKPTIDLPLRIYLSQNLTNKEADQVISRTIITLSSNADEVADYAFFNCQTLKTASLPSAQTIHSNAFYGCIKLEEINLPSATVIEGSAFRKCQSLTQLQLPAVKSIGANAFQECSGLQSVSLPTVAELGNSSFAACIGLTVVDAPLATTFGTGVFQNCTSLLTATLPSAEALAGSTFRSCSTLTGISLPNIKTIGTYCFSGCSALEYADFGALNQIPTNAFSQCTSLTKLILRGDSVCSFVGASTFASTPIANGAGLIYVPAALLESYQITSGWSNYAEQFRAIETLL